MSPTVNYDGTIAGSAVYMAPIDTQPMPDVPRRWYEHIPGLRRLYAPRAHRVRTFAGWELMGWVAEDGLTIEPPTKNTP